MVSLWYLYFLRRTFSYFPTGLLKRTFLLEIPAIFLKRYPLVSIGNPWCKLNSSNKLTLVISFTILAYHKCMSLFVALLTKFMWILNLLFAIHIRSYYVYLSYITHTHTHTTDMNHNQFDSIWSVFIFMFGRKLWIS